MLKQWPFQILTQHLQTSKLFWFRYGNHTNVTDTKNNPNSSTNHFATVVFQPFWTPNQVTSAMRMESTRSCVMMCIRECCCLLLTAGTSASRKTMICPATEEIWGFTQLTPIALFLPNSWPHSHVGVLHWHRFSAYPLNADCQWCHSDRVLRTKACRQFLGAAKRKQTTINK